MRPTKKPTAERLALVALALVALVGCDDGEFGQSCGGAPVLVCPAYEWATIEDASLTPDELTLGDVSARARVQVTMRRCDQAPAIHDVAVSLLVPEDGAMPDGGAPMLEVFNVVTVRNDEEGDEAVGGDAIDVEIVNPFNSTLPAQRSAMLRFEAISRASGCGSGTFEIPYRTGVTD